MPSSARRAPPDATRCYPGYGFRREPGRWRAVAPPRASASSGRARTCSNVSATRSRQKALARTCGAPDRRQRRRGDARRAHLLRRAATGAAMLVKAVAGGGGRGMRIVRAADGSTTRSRAAASEARRVRQWRAVRRALARGDVRHAVEVQVIGDAAGTIAHLGSAVQPAAAAPEADRDRAQPWLPMRCAGRSSRPRARARARGALPSLGTFESWSMRDSGRSSSWRPTRGCRWSTP